MKICPDCKHLRCRSCTQIAQLCRKEKRVAGESGKEYIRRELTGDKKDYFLCCECRTKTPIKRVKWQPTMRLL